MDEEERTRLAAKYDGSALALPKLDRAFHLSPTRATWVLCLLGFLFLLSTIRVPLQRSDDIYFYVGAVSLAHGQGYADVSRPDAPPLLKYPPIRSIVQVPFIPLLTENIRPLRLIGMAGLVAMLLLSFRLLAPRFGPQKSLLVVGMSLINPTNVRAVNFEGSGTILVLLYALVFLIVDRIKITAERSVPNGAMTGLVFSLCFYTHRMGILLIIVALLYIWFTKRRKTAIVAAIATACLCAPWLVRSYHYSGHWISPEYEAEFSGRIQADGVGDSFAVATLRHLANGLRDFPMEFGYGLFPWWRASGGAPWPWLESTGLVWAAKGVSWLLSAIMVFGWWKSLRRNPTFVEWFFPAHVLLMMTFFVGFQYFSMFYPWLFLWLWRGASELSRGRLTTRNAAIGAAILCAVALAKDVKAFWLLPSSLQDRDLRWSWVAKIVPENEAVYYEGLDNYAWAPLRWFDSRRMAVGFPPERAEDTLSQTTVRWLSVSSVGPTAALARARGWQTVVSEIGQLPTAAQLPSDLSDAQRNFQRMQAPPQTLFRRP